MKMVARTRAVGLAALIGFLSITAWSAGLVPAPCCAASCESCPPTFCKDTAAKSSPKLDIDHPLVLASAGRFLPPEDAALAVAGSQIPPFLSHEFHRPMRR